MQKVAVFFGGKSYEHDISILTGLQVCMVMDITKYQPFPVYVNKVGRMFTGDQLRDPKFYPILEFREAQLTEVVIPVGETYPCLQKRFGLIKKKIPFDIAFLAFHGAEGESGGFQGLFDAANIPYTGATTLASAVYMDKVITKDVCRAIGINVLDGKIVLKPKTDMYDIKSIMADVTVKFPVMAKPRSLGSSVGIHKCEDAAELAAACINIFKLNDDVLIEQFVPNLVEYNIAVIKNKKGDIITSAIERPNPNGNVLSFADKYMSDGGKKKGIKKGAKGLSIMPTQELLTARREYHPENLTAAQEKFIRESAAKLFAHMGATGSPRIDFLSDAKTGEVWLNEVNPIPGSFAFYLWAAALTGPLDYQEIVSTLLHNANFKAQNIDLKHSGSIVFK